MRAVDSHKHGGPEVLACGGVNTAAIPIAKLARATVYVVGSTVDKLEGGNVFGKLALRP
jgi:hypothetical protein